MEIDRHKSIDAVLITSLEFEAVKNVSQSMKNKLIEVTFNLEMVQSVQEFVTIVVKKTDELLGKGKVQEPPIERINKQD